MDLLGALAMMTALVRDGGSNFVIDENLVLVPICFLIGCAIGLPNAPLVVALLLRKSIRAVVWFVYVPSAVVVTAYAWLRFSESVFYPLDCAIPAFSSVWALSFVAFFVLPNVRTLPRHRCGECDYDLRGHHHERCPECGAAVQQQTERS